MVNVIVNRNCW